MLKDFSFFYRVEENEKMSVSLQLILKGQKMQQDALEGLKILVFKGKGEEKKKKNFY